MFFPCCRRSAKSHARARKKPTTATCVFGDPRQAKIVSGAPRGDATKQPGGEKLIQSSSVADLDDDLRETTIAMATAPPPLLLTYGDPDEARQEHQTGLGQCLVVAEYCVRYAEPLQRAVGKPDEHSTLNCGRQTLAPRTKQRTAQAREINSASWRTRKKKKKTEFTARCKRPDNDRLRHILVLDSTQPLKRGKVI